MIPRGINLRRHDQLVSPDGRRWVIDSVTRDARVLLARDDRRPREHSRVWKDLAEVLTWRRE